MELTKTYQLISSFNLTYGAMRTYAKYSDQSVSDNTTTYQIKQVYYNSASGYTGFDSATAVLDGTQKKYNSYTRMYPGETTIQELTRVIEHNLDGSTPTKNVETSWTASFGGSGSTSTNITFPNIARYSIITEAPNFNDEENPTIKFTTQIASGIQVSVHIQNADGTQSLVGRNNIDYSSGTYTFTLSDAERNILRNLASNSKTLSVRFAVVSLLNGNYYTSYLSRTLTIVNANPTFSIAYQDTNATTLAVTNNDQQIIQNISTLQINVSSASAKKGASLSSVSVNINGTITTETISSSTKNINIGAVNLSDNITVPITLTDSRGNSTTSNLTITMLPYELPSAIITVKRHQNYYTETDIKADCTYSSLDSKNTLTIQYRTKKTSDANYGAYASLTNNVTTTFNADNSYSWNIQVLLTDVLGSTTYNFQLDAGMPILFLDRKRKSLGLNCFPQNDRSIEVNDYGIGTTGWKVLLPYVMYEDSTGTTGDVSLNSSAVNFDYLEIYYHTGGGWNICSSTKIYKANNKTVALSLNTYNTSVSDYRIWMSNISISGMTITRSNAYYVDSSGVHNAGNYIYITRVVGYR